MVEDVDGDDDDDGWYTEHIVIDNIHGFKFPKQSELKRILFQV